MVEQCWWNNYGGTVIEEQLCWNSQSVAVVVDQAWWKRLGGTVIVEQ